MTQPVTRKLAVYCLLYRLAHASNYDITTGKCVLICKECGLPIEPGQDIQFDHIHADVFDGPNEYQNLRPMHRNCHKRKTKRDITANAKIKRIRGETKQWPKRAIPSKPFPKTSRPMRSART